MLPTGPICYRYRRDIAYHPVVCPECLELRPIAYPSLSNCNALVCAGCAGEESIFACAGCGREDHPYDVIRRARCILKERLTMLLTDPDAGQFRVELTPLFEELIRAHRPQSVITWLTKPPAIGPAILGQMARGDLPISHNTFRTLPAGRAENYLRDLLAATGILPPDYRPIEQMERWLAARLTNLATDDAALIGRYARWHLLRRLRGQAERGELSKPAIYAARGNINGAIRLSTWATAHDTTIAALTQPQLESYLAEYPGGHATQQTFIAWLRRSKENTRVAIPWRGITPEVTLSDDERWTGIDRLFNNDRIVPYARIGGLFMLLFAQQLHTRSSR